MSLYDQIQKVTEIKTQKSNDFYKSLQNNRKLSRLNAQKNKIVSISGAFKIPIELAIDQALCTQEDNLNYWHHETEKAKKTNPDATLFSVYQEKMATSEKPCSLVSSIKLIGGNGIGKTEIIIPQVCEWLREKGFNPIVYKDIIGKESVYYPTSENPEKDVLICFVNCTGLEATEIRGLPLREDKEEPIYENFKPTNKTRTVASLKYSEVPKWSSIKNFAQTILILDEVNRSPELNLFNSIMNGEAVNGVQLSPTTIIFSMQNSELDGLNDVMNVDLASKTKTSIYPVYQTVSDWSNWAVANQVHPAVIAFMSFFPKAWEDQKDNGHEIASPTFRGATIFSNGLKLLERHGKDSFNEIKILFQSRLGYHADYQDLPTTFAKFYDEIHLGIIKDIEETLRKDLSPFQIGFADQEKNKAILNALNITEKQFGLHLDEEETQNFEFNGDNVYRWIHSLPSYLTSYLYNCFSVPEKSFVNLAVIKALQENNITVPIEVKKDPNLILNYPLYETGLNLLKENIKQNANLLDFMDQDYPVSLLVEKIRSNYLLDVATDQLNKFFALSKIVFDKSANFLLFIENVKQIKIDSIYEDLYRDSFALERHKENIVTALVNIALAKFRDPYIFDTTYLDDKFIEEETKRNKLIYFKDDLGDFFEQEFDYTTEANDLYLSSYKYIPYKDAIKKYNMKIDGKYLTESEFIQFIDFIYACNGELMTKDLKTHSKAVDQTINL